MAKTTRSAKPPGRRLLDSALKLSVLFIVVSILLISAAGSAFKELPVWQAVAFAIFGAVLQIAVLGLIYEVFLRNEVEDATLEKLNVTRDVREHGLVKLGREATIDWALVLEATRELCIVTHDPKGLLGLSDDQVLRRAAEGFLNRVTIIVPEQKWKESEEWLTALRDKWARTAPSTEFYAARSDLVLAYEFIGTDSGYIVLLPSLSDAPGLEARKLLGFKKSEDWGIGSWLSRQMDELRKLTPAIGHAPPPPPPSTGKKQPAPSSSRDLGEAAEPEELT